MRKCALCGKETEYEICPECYIERNEIYDIEPYLQIKTCPKCGRFFVEKWTDVDLSRALHHSALRSFRYDPEFKIDSFEISEIGENRCVLHIEGSFRGLRIERDHYLEFRQKREVCDRCSRYYGGYFEAIIQLRAENRELEKDEVELAKKLILKEIEKEVDNPGAFVSKIEELEEGIDFYIGSRNIARKAVRRMENEIGGVITESQKIAGRKDGRDIFRTTYSIRLKEYRNGDAVRDGDEVYIVVNAVKNKAMDSSGKLHVLKNPVLVRKRDEIEKAVVVNVDASVVEVLRPYDQKTVLAENHWNPNIGEEVFYVEEGDRVYIFPIIGK
ncbi:NMD protein affecting ribosome stability and mRNA decay [Archaeoglobus sulfaticallidus PM70-1]|uniref:NMD protein affecting ribosome stability and mRNA decay n=1 Tax=Archaeoglobus sulfaticallidus PM70-1 TaxID=387631 RepID=N0BF56_9EURY|nr:60S ribosomal export protein NMD3 [Archaeoglobus sulfaticallidus]AGK61653.1 NMD protein affecting ribosome stability and mRNA decay [Archaeoglobus sulfaticallidus PM70-1]